MKIIKQSEQYTFSGEFIINRIKYNYNGYLTREPVGSMMLNLSIIGPEKITTGNVFYNINIDGIVNVTYGNIPEENKSEFIEYSNKIIKEILEYFS